jgi:hypothetical protein
MVTGIEVETKDTTALSDAEIAEMADLCVEAAGVAGFPGSGQEVGFLSKQREEWVLVTTARESGQLRAFVLATLERIGGTPCLLVGVASVARGSVAEGLLCATMRDLYRRAVLAFPDEDVLVGARLAMSAGYRAYAGLEEIVPRSAHKATGEERAWGRRLAKRFGAEGRLDDRTFVLTGDGGPCGLLDYFPETPPEGVEAFEEFFSDLVPERGDTLVVFGWAMAEDLAGGALLADGE